MSSEQASPKRQWAVDPKTGESKVWWEWPPHEQVSGVEEVKKLIDEWEKRGDYSRRSLVLLLNKISNIVDGMGRFPEATAGAEEIVRGIRDLAWAAANKQDYDDTLEEKPIAAVRQLAGNRDSWKQRATDAEIDQNPRASGADEIEKLIRNVRFGAVSGSPEIIAQRDSDWESLIAAVRQLAGNRDSWKQRATDAEGAYSLNANIADTCRSRGFGPLKDGRLVPPDERVIAMAQALDAARDELATLKAEMPGGRIIERLAAELTTAREELAIKDQDINRLRHEVAALKEHARQRFASRTVPT